MKHATIKIAGFCAVLLLVVAIIYLHSSQSVLLRYQEPAAVDPSDLLYVLFNPFRDRQPEYSATAFLKKLKENKCEEALTFETGEVKSRICDREHERKLIDWTLVDRNDEETKTVLFFEAYRSGYSPGSLGNVWVTVEKKDVWQVTGFESWY